MKDENVHSKQLNLLQTKTETNFQLEFQLMMITWAINANRPIDLKIDGVCSNQPLIEVKRLLLRKYSEILLLVFSLKLKQLLLFRL